MGILLEQAARTFPRHWKPFFQQMDQWNYLPVFYESSEEMSDALHEFRYDFIKFGEKYIGSA